MSESPWGAPRSHRGEGSMLGPLGGLLQGNN